MVGKNPVQRSVISKLGFGWLLLAWWAGSGCSITKYVQNKAADVVAHSGTTFASDDDPELIQAAAPFSLKLMESLLAENPRHVGLLTATASGFTQFSYAFVQQPADEIEPENFAAAEKMRAGATALSARPTLRPARAGGGASRLPGRSPGPPEIRRASRHQGGCAPALLDGGRLGLGHFPVQG